MTAAIPLGNNFTLVPQASLITGQSQLDRFSVMNNFVTVDAGKDTSSVGRVGARLSYSQPLSETVFLVPFVGASHWQNFKSQTDVDFIVANPGAPLPISASTQNAKAYQQYELGVSLTSPAAGVTGFVTGTLRSGEAVKGSTISAGGRINF